MKERNEVQKIYQRPELDVLTGMMEGVYMSSGSEMNAETEGTITCQSVYMKGEWHKPQSGANSAPIKERRGCEGCSADDGDGCKLLKGGELNPNGSFKPKWERSGVSPDTLVW